MTLPKLMNRYLSDLPETAYQAQAPRQPSAPYWLLANLPLGEDLGLPEHTLTSDAGARLWSGACLPTDAEPVALAYAGHQFGMAVPQLGDGRALIIGQLMHADGDWRDLQLKGSGPTAFSRRGDGLAALGPVLREYLVSEAMHALGIATTRSLAALGSGESIAREFGPEPGAILVRVARSHLRFGSFEYFAHRGDEAALKRLADTAIAWHFPTLQRVPAPQRYQQLLSALVDQTAALISEWMRVGFIHGVLNTDNMSIAGETLDYGPCAFMDGYRHDQVYSAVDRGGRYAYNQQPPIGQWNLTRLAECLLPLLDDDQTQAIDTAEGILDEYSQRFQQHHEKALLRKIGLLSDATDQRRPAVELSNQLLALMHTQACDFTMTFRLLADYPPSEPAQIERLKCWFNHDPAMVDWIAAYTQALSAAAITEPERQAQMAAANPLYIARNHQIEAAIDAARQGNLKPAERLTRVLRAPYTEQRGAEDLAQPPALEQRVTTTFCGT